MKKENNFDGLFESEEFESEEDKNPKKLSVANKIGSIIGPFMTSKTHPSPLKEEAPDHL